MLPAFGMKLSSLPRTLLFVRELEAFEGAILSEYHAADGATFYLEKWCAQDGNTNRWLMVRTEQRAIAEYLGGRVSLLDVLQGPSDSVGFLVDRTADGEIDAVYLVSLSELPAGYLPKHTAYHDESLRPAWSTVPQSFLIGETWDAALLGSIERTYLSAYGFAYFTEPGKGRKLPEGILGYWFDGGYPIMHVNRRIRAAVPRSDRARSVGVSAGSPGVLTIEAPADTANHVAASLKALPHAGHGYNAVQEWARQKPPRAGLPFAVPFGDESAVRNLRSLCDALLVDVNVILPELPTDSAERKFAILAAGKLIAAHYRRLWRLLDTDNGFEFVSVDVEEETEMPAPVFDEEDEGDS